MNRAALVKAINKLIPDEGFVYVDCGARSGKAPRWLRSVKGAVYVGIDADEEECARLNARNRPGHRYLPATIGRAPAVQTFHITRSPACASLLAPNLQFVDRFLDLGDRFRVEREVVVQTVDLDTYLPAHGVRRVDFLELDTQGSELDILSGAARFLDETVVGLQVEVEFAPLYEAQPLFGEVDGFLRDHGFMVFDLSRYHARRRSIDAPVPTRGQLLWGHAVYLRDHARIVSAEMSLKLALTAALLGVPDYAAEILDSLTSSVAVTDAQRRSLGLLRRLLATPSAERMTKVFDTLQRKGLGGMARWMGAVGTRLRDSYEATTSRRRYFWRD